MGDDRLTIKAILGTAMAGMEILKPVVALAIWTMVMWLWIGGGLMGIGTLLSAFPGRRRKPTDATSAPVPSEASA